MNRACIYGEEAEVVHNDRLAGNLDFEQARKSRAEVRERGKV